MIEELNELAIRHEILCKRIRKGEATANEITRELTACYGILAFHYDRAEKAESELARYKETGLTPEEIETQLHNFRSREV